MRSTSAGAVNWKTGMRRMRPSEATVVLTAASSRRVSPPSSTPGSPGAVAPSPVVAMACSRICTVTFFSCRRWTWSHSSESSGGSARCVDRAVENLRSTSFHSSPVFCQTAASHSNLSSSPNSVARWMGRQSAQGTEYSRSKATLPGFCAVRSMRISASSTSLGLWLTFWRMRTPARSRSSACASSCDAHSRSSCSRRRR